MKNRNLNHSDNWATPDWLYNQLNGEFNFDFDPCPLNDGEITPDKDGLIIEWGVETLLTPILTETKGVICPQGCGRKEQRKVVCSAHTS